MPDISKWDADLPGDTPAWWLSRKAQIPKKVEEEFQAFIAALKVYHADFSDENRDYVIYAIEDVVTKLVSETAPRGLRVVILDRIQIGGKKKPGLMGTNLEIGLRNLMASMGPPTMSRGHRAGPPKTYQDW